MSLLLHVLGSCASCAKTGASLDLCARCHLLYSARASARRRLDLRRAHEILQGVRAGAPRHKHLGAVVRSRSRLVHERGRAERRALYDIPRAVATLLRGRASRSSSRWGAPGVLGQLGGGRTSVTAAGAALRCLALLPDVQTAVHRSGSACL